jgi:uracil-DNA glycosylase family 4
MRGRATFSNDLSLVQQRVCCCRRCPELREYCREVARTKRRAYRDWSYWGKPVPGFGDRAARILIVGLAPAAHGGNRTGRVFTGDRSGDFLFSALYRAGLANQPTAVHRDDGLTLRDVYITAAARCAPRANKPTPAQLSNCASFLREEFRILSPCVTICLGGIAWNAVMSTLRALGFEIPRPRPRFGHGAEQAIGPTTVLGCFHVSQQNTFTGRLTAKMIDDVLKRARQLSAAARAGLHCPASSRESRREPTLPCASSSLVQRV